MSRRRRWILFLFPLSLLLAGCAGTEEVAEQPEQAQPQQQAPPPAVSFQMSTDTVDVLRRGERGSSVPEYTPGDPVWSVQIGAFRQSGNATAAENLARERFAHPIVRYHDQAGLLHIRVGRFSTRMAAEELISEMRRSYPGDYQDCWIVRLGENQ